MSAPFVSSYQQSVLVIALSFFPLIADEDISKILSENMCNLLGILMSFFVGRDHNYFHRLIPIQTFLIIAHGYINKFQ